MLVVHEEKNQIALEGATFGKTGITFSDTSEKTLSRVGVMLGLMESCVEWGWADYLPRLVAQRQGGVAAKPKRNETAEQLELRCVAEFAELTGRDAQRLAERDRVGRFFPPEVRRPGLSFDHHAEAWAGAKGDLKRASEWLTRAEEKRWSVADLRAYIRRSTAPMAAPRSAPAPEVVAELDLSELEMVSARRLRAVKSADANAARAMLDALKTTSALVDELRRRANADASNVRLTRAGPPQALVT